MLLLALTNILYAQTSCKTPLPNQQFTQKFNQLKNSPNERSRLQFGIQLVKSFCFSSAQLKDLASLFANDYDRLEFAKAAYQNTTDKENFYDVYDAFIYYSNVFRLHDFLKNKSITERSSPTRKEIKFPDYQYPSIRNYRDTRNCNRIIDSRDFDIITNKITTAKKLIETNKCFSALQIKNLVDLFDYESARVDIAKYGYQYTTNKSQYYTIVSEVLGFESSKKKLLDYINTQ